jgi:antirestriction protein ArdC
MATKRSCSGINVLLLGLQEQYNYAFWGTFNQISQLGGKVRKGEKSTEIVFSEFIIRNKQSKRRIIFEEYKQLSKAEQENYIMLQKTDKVNHPQRMKVSIAERLKVSHLQRAKVSH